MRSSLFNIIVPLAEGGQALLFHGYSGAVDLVQEHIADLLRKKGQDLRRSFDSICPETLSQLQQRGYLIDRSPEEEEAYVVELGKCVHRFTRRHAAPGVLLVPTYSCNLRCSYCYEQGLWAKGDQWLRTRMSPDLAEAALEAAHRLGRNTRPSRALTLYGGEPFQRENQGLVRFLYERALTRGYQRFSAITNALELESFEDLLGPSPKFSFLQVTLDGPPHVHDQRRCRPDRQGSFEQITGNIGLALERRVRVSVRVNVDRRNVEHLSALAGFFHSRGWDAHPGFRAYCSPVHGGACGRKSPSHFDSHLDMQRQAGSSMFGVTEDGPSSPFQVASFTHAIRLRIRAHLDQKGGLPHWKTAFCGSNVSMYLFDPFGDIYPCWEVIGRDQHRVGRYGPGFLNLDAESLDHWHARSVVAIPACRRCAYLFFCGGGCEAFAYQATGRFNEPHCFDFPEHFQTAARLAYQEWQDRGPETRTSEQKS